MNNNHLKHKTYLGIIFCLISSPSFATVGGPETIEVLGSDIKDQKIYYLRHYHDESGRLPTLYYYLLNSRNPHKAIEVQSIYTPLNSRNHITETQHTLRKIQSIQARLVKPAPLSPKTANLKLNKQREQTGNFWLNVPEIKVSKFQSQVQLSQSSKPSMYKSQQFENIRYHRNLPQIKKLYAFPHTFPNYRVAIISYMGIPTETGYEKQDAILLCSTK